MNIHNYCITNNLTERNIIYRKTIYRIIVKVNEKFKIKFKTPNNNKHYIYATFISFCEKLECCVDDFVISKKNQIIKNIKNKKYKSPSTLFYQKYKRIR